MTYSRGSENDLVGKFVKNSVEMNSKCVMTDDQLNAKQPEMSLLPIDSMGVQEDIETLLKGSGLGEGVVDVDSKSEEKFVPMVKHTVCYIVCGVVFNDEGEILMMQEAKSSCHGMWYLPAGRMESNESIVEGVKREVLEETGIIIEPTSLLCVEVASGFWYRYTLTGRVVGGCLKTLEQKDRESLQARWCSIDTIKSGRSEFPLRSIDVIPLIDIAMKHKTTSPTHMDLLPSHNPFTNLVLRILFVYVDKNSSTPKVIYGRRPLPHLPTAIISTHDTSLHNTVFRLISSIFGHCKCHPNISGVLSVEHTGKPAAKCDGVCFTVLATIANTEGELPKIKGDNYVWVPVEAADQKEKLLARIPSNQNLPLLLLR